VQPPCSLLTACWAALQELTAKLIEVRNSLHAEHTQLADANREIKVRRGK
jgi:hypothetical protein